MKSIFTYMKDWLKKTFFFIIKYISILYSYNTNSKISVYKNVIYSKWLQANIINCGKIFFVQKPAMLKGHKYMSFGNNFSAGYRLRIECWDEYRGSFFKPSVVFGDNVSLNNNIHIGCINSIKIGSNVLLASNIYITDHHHGFVDYRDLNISPAKRLLNSKGPVIIEDNVWIGENVVIMPNVTIGKACIIGANSVVTKSFPEYCVIAGNPARILKRYN